MKCVQQLFHGPRVVCELPRQKRRNESMCKTFIQALNLQQTKKWNDSENGAKLTCSLTPKHLCAEAPLFESEATEQNRPAKPNLNDTDISTVALR